MFLPDSLLCHGILCHGILFTVLGLGWGLSWLKLVLLMRVFDHPACFLVPALTLVKV